MRILISGAGIAGPMLAYWLAHFGFEVTILEKASALRTGGYIIDFWGAGFEVADRMGLLPRISELGYKIQQVRVVNASGKTVAEFSADAFTRATRGRYTSLARGDLAAAIFSKVNGNVEAIFGDSVDSVQQTEKAVRVQLESGRVREFDLLVGADGLHSRVREVVFGPEASLEKYLGYKAAAFEATGYRPRDELVYVLNTQVGRQIARFSMRDDRTMFLFTFADQQMQDVAVDDMNAQKQLIRSRFQRGGWECPRILDALDASDHLYFDRVSQIRMGPRQGLWTRGRVILLGDAAFCVSLLAGQGSALAMVGAYLLAGEIYRARGNYTEAFQKYQKKFAPFIAAKQKAALRFASAFAPSSRPALFLRNEVMKLMKFQFVADLAMGRDLSDNIVLPQY